MSLNENDACQPVCCKSYAEEKNDNLLNFKAEFGHKHFIDVKVLSVHGDYVIKDGAQLHNFKTLDYNREKSLMSFCRKNEPNDILSCKEKTVSQRKDLDKNDIECIDEIIQTGGSAASLCKRDLTSVIQEDDDQLHPLKETIISVENNSNMCCNNLFVRKALLNPENDLDIDLDLPVKGSTPAQSLCEDTPTCEKNEDIINVNDVVCTDHSVPKTENYNVGELKIVSINVCGLCSKLKTPDFEDFVNNHDIIFLTETKLDDLDNCNISGYTLFRKNRGVCKKKSGGIGVFVKNCYTENIKIVENVSFQKRIVSDKSYYKFVNFHVPNETLFLKLSGVTVADCVMENKPILFGVSYVSPSSSDYVNRHFFEEMELCLSHFDDCHILLTGDFNARTGDLTDFLWNDNEDLTGDENMSDIIDVLGIQKKRLNSDKVYNQFGCDLVDFCISQGLLIMNGRTGKDKNIGKPTCKGVSVVDYFLANPSLFPSVVDFDVLDFDKLLSDVHSPVYVILKVNFLTVNRDNVANSESNVENECITKFIWNPDKSQEFTSYIDKELNVLDNRMFDLLDDIANVEQGDVDGLTSSFCNLFKDSAKKCDMYEKRCSKKKVGTRVRQKKDLPWIDNECRNARKIYRRARRNHRIRTNLVMNAVVNRAYKQYKTLIDKNYNIFVSNTRKKIRKLRTTNPKKYWKIINGTKTEKQSEMSAISKEVLAEHFENLSNVEPGELFEPSLNENDVHVVNEQLNAVITKEEVLKCIRGLKNNKACGFDEIMNEFLKASDNKMIRSITLLFNLILISGKIPSSWAIGCIRPLYKGKGSFDDPDNYRGITVLSCFGKLFTSVINLRIKAFLENNNLIGNEQAGFRSNNSTTDHIFVLHCLVDLYLQRKKKLYCLFVDYKKAFDLVQRSLLWDKLLQIGVNGKVLSIIRDMYSKAKSCVRQSDGTLSNFFISNIGLRQGENLSPILFTVFLNDLKDFLSINVSDLSVPLDIAKNLLPEQIDDFMKLFILLYADDTAVLAENEKEMQKAVKMLEHYCDIWGLKININKTKIVVFSRGKIRNLPKITFDNANIEIVFDYRYLGVIFNYNNKFAKCIKDKCTSANRAMFSLLVKCRKLSLPLDIQIDLFEKCVTPIILYGSEIWGFHDISRPKRLQLKFLKIILNLKPSTPTCMVLGEAGVYPIDVDVKSRMLAFWYKLKLDCNSDSKKMSCLFLSLISRQYEFTEHKSAWLGYVYQTLDQLGLTYLKHNQTLSVQKFKDIVKQKLRDQFLQSWSEQLNTSNMCMNYRIFKTEFRFEKYLLSLPHALRKVMIKFRICNNNLPVNRSRYFNIPRKDRVCTLCDCNDIGDEYHYLLVCRHRPISQERQLCIKRC